MATTGDPAPIPGALAAHQPTQLTEADAGELLTLQRAAYVSEAQLNGDPFLPALTQSLDEFRTDLRKPALGTRIEGRLVASVRWTVEDDCAHIGRLVVAPDMQGLGVGTQLLRTAEKASGATRFELFTGARSEANLRLYEREGYREKRRETLQPGVEIVLLTTRAQ